MCGIAGILRFSGEAEQSAAGRDEVITAALKHRGPDAQATLHRGNLSLYHTRLKIVDTSDASAQPFFYKEKNDALVFNGEIFNYRELAAGIPDLQTQGDVEVLYRLLQDKGNSCLHALNGFFAFAYADARQNLLVARDRYGVKPLYYYHDKDKFAFASELAALMELCGPQPLNTNQLYTYFRLNYCSGPETIFRNVYRLEPGQLLRVQQGRLERDQWYRFEAGHKRSGDLFALLDDAVKLRLRADVPAGAFLSGGLDSSIISALAVRHQPNLKTFSLGFHGNTFLDESRHAEEVARHIRTDHHLLRLREADFIAGLDDFLDSVDEPFADSSAFNLYMLARHSRKYIKVALSGDGADELFKGYNKHRAFMLSGRIGGRVVAVTLSGLLKGTGSSRGSKLSNTRRQAEKFSVLASLPHSERLKFLASISNHAECASLLNEGVSSIYFDSLFSESAMLPGFSAEDQFDLLRVLPDDMLVKTDRFSMRHGLEVRNPFLDYRVVEHALSLPLSEKLTLRRQKLALRNTFGKLLPKSTLNRPKKGFELPLEKWLRNDLSGRIEKEWLPEERIREEKLFSYPQIRKYIEQLRSGSPGDTPAKIWALIVFEHWLGRFSRFIASAPPQS